MRTVKVFLASSEELAHERLLFPRLVLELNSQLREKGVRLDLVKWEYLDASLGPLHKQEEYNRELATCEIAFVLFWRKFGEYTDEEFRVALEGLRRGRRPRALAVLFKVDGEPMTDDLAAFRDSLADEAGGFSVSDFSSDGQLLDFSRSFIMHHVLVTAEDRNVEDRNRQGEGANGKI